MKKVILSLLSILILSSFTATIIFYYNNIMKDKKGNTIDSFAVEEVMETTTTTAPVAQIDDMQYKKLTIESLYAKSQKSDDVSKISWYYKANEKTYYLFLPKLIDRNRVIIEFNTQANTLLSIYDNEDNLVGKYTTNSEVSLTKEDYTFKLETNVDNVMSYKVKVLSSKLPSLYINLEGGDNAFRTVKASPRHLYYVPGVAAIADENNNITNVNVEKFKGRGNATWRRKKRPFSVIFTEDVSAFGMKEADGWNLLANYYDGTMVRNELWYSFSRDIGLEYSPESKMIEVYINNKYEGTYSITSKVEVDKNRVDISENEYLVEMDLHIGKNQFRLAHGYPVVVHNPDPTKYNYTDRRQIYSEMKTYLNKIESLIYNPNVTAEELSQYMDLESFAKYYWVNEISLNMDASRNSVYFYTKDGKLYAGPVWDMDATLNRSYPYANNLGYYILNDPKLPYRSAENWFKPLMKKQGFSDIVDRVYFENEELINDLPAKVGRLYDFIYDSQRMNYVRWNYAEMIRDQWDVRWINGNHDFESAYSMLTRDITNRIDWYKKQYANLKYSDIIYKVFDEEVIQTGKAYEEKCLIIPKNSKRIEIYGLDENNEEVLLNSVDVNDQTYIDASFIRSNPVRSLYKKSNRYVYNISFIIQ